MRISTILLFICASCLLVSAQSEKAALAYANRDYAGAFTAYEKELRETQKDSAKSLILANLGNCLFRQSDYAKAIWYYKKSLRLAPSNMEVESNVRIAQSRLGVSSSNSVQTEGPWNFLDPFLVPTALLWVVLIQIVCFAALVFLKPRGLARGTVIVALSIALFAGVRIWYLESISQQTQAVVLSPILAVKDEPLKSAPSRMELRSGTLIHVDARSSRWARIRIGAQEGWVEVQKIGVIE